jgi:hypothetical protein
MKLVGILGAQAVLIFALDLFCDTHLCLWLLYFLPLLGTARLPSVGATIYGAIAISVLVVAGGLCKLGQTPWEEIFVPRALAIYALGLTAVLLVRGKQFGTRARDAVAEAEIHVRESDAEGRLRKDLETAKQTLHGLSQQHHEACEVQNSAEAGRIQAEIEKLLGVLNERLS